MVPNPHSPGTVRRVLARRPRQALDVGRQHPVQCLAIVHLVLQRFLAHLVFGSEFAAHVDRDDLREGAHSLVRPTASMVVGGFARLDQTRLGQRFEQMMLDGLRCVLLRRESLVVPAQIVELEQNVAFVGGFEVELPLGGFTAVFLGFRLGAG